MDIDKFEGFKGAQKGSRKKQTFNKKYYKYEKKKPDIFIGQLIKDIKHNGSAYVKSYITLQELIKYEPKLTYIWVKDDNLYLVRFR